MGDVRENACNRVYRNAFLSRWEQDQRLTSASAVYLQCLNHSPKQLMVIYKTTESTSCRQSSTRRTLEDQWAKVCLCADADKCAQVTEPRRVWRHTHASFQYEWALVGTHERCGTHRDSRSRATKVGRDCTLCYDRSISHQTYQKQRRQRT